MRLQGKTALVTAAGQGIGHASVLAMAAEGAQVIATDINPQLLASYEGVPNVRTAVLNVLDKAAIQSLVATMPPLNVLFNCAGVVHNGRPRAPDGALALVVTGHARKQHRSRATGQGGADGISHG